MDSDYGVKEAAHDWLTSYFIDRTQSVNIDSVSSSQHKLVTGFPQGSVLGPFSYPVYTAALFRIAEKHGVIMHMYADDTQLFISFDPPECEEAKLRMMACLKDIRKWMAEHHLKLNDDKTEVMLIGSKHNLKKINSVSSIMVGDTEVNIVKSAKNIGVIIDSNLSMEQQVNNVTRLCYMHMYQIGKIRQFLDETTAGKLVCSLVLSRLDFSNALLFGLPDSLLDKLQAVQNNAAHLVMKRSKHEHVTPLLAHLHWLPVRQRIRYKILLLTFKCLLGQAPSYLSELLELYVPTRSLRSSSSSQNLLRERRSKLKRCGDRAFAVCAPKLWNKLPESLHTITTLNAVKSILKTYIYKDSFNEYNEL